MISDCGKNCLGRLRVALPEILDATQSRYVRALMKRDHDKPLRHVHGWRKAPVKLSQHFNAISLEATCYVRLATPLRGVARCCDMIGVDGSNLWMLHDVVVVWPGSCNNVAPGHAH